MPPVTPPPSTWKRVSPWVWEPSRALFLYACFLFFLDHSLGRDALGTTVVIIALLLAVGLSRLLWPTPERWLGVRRMATRVVVLFLVANAALGALEASTINRSMDVLAALQQCLYDYGLYPASLEELGGISSTSIPPTAMGLRHSVPFHYERFGGNGEHYTLSFDAPMFRVCSLSDDSGRGGSSLWQCSRKAGSTTTP